MEKHSEEALAETELKFSFHIDPTSSVELEESMKNPETYKLLTYLDAVDGRLPAFSPC